jgi:hypothetical protein
MFEQLFTVSVFRVFPGELAIHEKDGQTHGTHHNQWMLPSMGHLLHMTLMVLAGLMKTPPALLKHSSSSLDSSCPRTPVKDSLSHHRVVTEVLFSSEEFVSFPMPPPFLFSPTKSLEVRDILGTPRLDPRPEASTAKTQPAQTQSVKCIRLGKADEAEMLWLETCKIFSELTNSTTSNTAQQAVDCLRVSVFCPCFLF